MRIGIDGSCLSNRRGFGRFARQVVKSLAQQPGGHDYVVVIDAPSAEMAELPADFERVVADVKVAPSQAASASGRRGVRDMLAMGLAAARARLDALYFPASYTFYPVWNVGRVAVTLHDTLAMAHPELVFSNWKGRVAWALKERAALRWADAVATVSLTARRDLSSFFGIAESKIAVIPEAPDAVFRPVTDPAISHAVLVKYGIDVDRPFLLYVGGLSPHKNLVRLIEAFAAGAPAEARLVLVGDLSDVFLTHVPTLRERIRHFDLQNRVIFTGFVPDEPLAAIYSRARAFIQPSLMEGFGLPPVEAMACGCPVLSSRAGSLPEVVGDAGLFFEPKDTGDMAEKIAAVFLDDRLRADLAGRSLDRAAHFSDRATANALFGLFDRLIHPSAARAA